MMLTAELSTQMGQRQVYDYFWKIFEDELEKPKPNHLSVCNMDDFPLGENSIYGYSMVAFKDALYLLVCRLFNSCITCCCGAQGGY